MTDADDMLPRDRWLLEKNQAWLKREFVSAIRKTIVPGTTANSMEGHESIRKAVSMMIADYGLFPDGYTIDIDPQPNEAHGVTIRVKVIPRD